MSNSKSVLTWLLLGSALATPALASPAVAAAHRSLSHYIVKDVGSFGGGFGLYSNPASRSINARGATAGMNSTAAEDPFSPNCFFDCLVDHAFTWHHGTTDLGGLAEGISSFAFAINDKSISVGVSQNGNLDLDTGFPIVHGVRWHDGAIEDLGTLGGTQSAGNAINLSGRVAGASATTASDDFVNVPQSNCLWLPTTSSGCGDADFGTNAFFLPVTTQTHAVVWSKKAGRDIGTLGGPDSTTIDINAAGQIVGWSYTSNEAGTAGVPDTHPFLWENGTTTDLGTLGGTFGAAVQINASGTVVGASNLSGDGAVHPFTWDKVNGMHDLGTLGGTYAHPDWINDLGDVVGYSRTGSGGRHAFYYHNSVIKDLGTLGDDPASEGFSVNNSGIIVGLTFDPGVEDLRGFVSDDGGPLVDLNTLITNPSKYYIIGATEINDRGEIAAQALMRNGEIQPVVLIPQKETTDSDHADAKGGMTAVEARRLLHAIADKTHPCHAQRFWPHFCSTH